MGKNTYVVLDMENSGEASSFDDLRSGYDPRRWEEISIEFTVPSYRETAQRKALEQKGEKEAYPAAERRRGVERRAEDDRRMGSEDRRSWQDYRWIGAQDCRSGKNDRRRGGDRRKNPDRRRK